MLEFPRDVQPILDRYCLDCHGPEQTARGGPCDGGVLLDGGRGPVYSISYVTLTRLREFTDGRDAGGNRPPRSIGSSASPLLGKLAGAHYGVRATPAEQRTVRLWIETGAPYPGTYAALGSGMVAPVDKNPGVREVFARRCDECHAGNRPEGGKLDPDTLFNLTEPEKSLALLMPLAAGDGGNAPFHKKRGEPTEPVVVFKDRTDPDYCVLLGMVTARKAELDKIKRFDMPGFRPNRHYLREMKIYGVLPPDFDLENDPVDPYAVDRRYWKLLQHQPAQASDPS